MSQRSVLIAAGVALLGCIAVGTVVVEKFGGHTAGGAPTVAATGVGPTGGKAADWTYERADAPARTIVHDRSGTVVATFTDNSRTVDVAAPERTFSEPKFTRATVTVDVAVRLAPQPWHAGAEKEAWATTWLTKELADSSPDALAIAFQYTYGAPDLYDADGIRYAGDAQFGPYSSTDPDGRAENNDFNDYLGITYNFSDLGPIAPHKDRYGDVDCSGFIRLVYGYRMGFPLRRGNAAGPGLPRRAVSISTVGPGTEVIHNTGAPARDYDALQPGDLVFFNVDPSDGPQVDHSGIFLGIDNSGHYRFISSRTLANGPTMGDSKYSAILDGSGHFALAFRNARRI